MDIFYENLILDKKMRIFNSLIGPKNAKGGLFGVINILPVAKYKKIDGAPLTAIKYFRKKVLQCQKIERGTLWDFPTSILLKNIKKLKGNPLVQSKNFLKKSHSAEKHRSGDP